MNITDRNELLDNFSGQNNGELSPINNYLWLGCEIEINVKFMWTESHDSFNRNWLITGSAKLTERGFVSASVTAYSLHPLLKTVTVK